MIGDHIKEHAILGIPQGSAIPRILVQSAIPFILAGGTAGGSSNQFTMGNNGAISTLPVLPTTYSSGAFIYMPANGIFAGSAAGWYWFVGSSATAGTVYNNTYTSGDPKLAVPATPTPFVSTGPGLVTQTTNTDIAAWQITLPGGSMGANGSLSVDVSGTIPNNVNGKGSRATLGGVVFGYADFSTNPGYTLTARMSNRNAQNSNMHFVNAGVTSGQAQTNTGASYSAVPTASDQLFTTVVRMTTASDFVVQERGRVVVEYGA